MEHACSKCGKLLEDGTPFCSECGEPQIRVTLASPYEPPPGTATPSATPDSSLPPPIPLQQFHAPAPGQVDWRRAWPGALMAGVLANFASLILPRPPFMFLCMLAGGALAVSLYRRRTHVGHLRPGQGFRIGALTGFFGFLFITLMGVLAFMSNSGRAELSTRMQQAMQQAMDQSSAGSIDPQTQQQMQNLISALNTPEGLATVLGFGLLIVMVFFVLLAGGGGALSAKIFGHDSR